jgi:hypothetical protein
MMRVRSSASVGCQRGVLARQFLERFTAHTLRVVFRRLISIAENSLLGIHCDGRAQPPWREARRNEHRPGFSDSHLHITRAQITFIIGIDSYD